MYEDAERSQSEHEELPPRELLIRDGVMGVPRERAFNTNLCQRASRSGRNVSDRATIRAGGNGPIMRTIHMRGRATNMIGYVTLGTNDLPRAAAFYDALLAEIGAKRLL